MSKPNTRILPMLAALATMSFTVPAFAQPEVTSVDVSARAPESVRLDVTGKDAAAVRPQIHAAANYVCRNAVMNHSVSIGDETWCADKSASKAMHQFAQIVSRRGLADSGVIVLSAR